MIEVLIALALVTLVMVPNITLQNAFFVRVVRAAQELKEALEQQRALFMAVLGFDDTQSEQEYEERAVTAPSSLSSVPNLRRATVTDSVGNRSVYWWYLPERHDEEE